MDAEFLLAHKDEIEPANKPGLYILMQKQLPPQFQAYRCGLAGKPVDSATQFKSAEGNLAPWRGGKEEG